MMFVEKGAGNGGFFARGCADICRHLVSELDREVDVVDPVVNRYFGLGMCALVTGEGGDG